jgi:hypothetical protein
MNSRNIIIALAIGTLLMVLTSSALWACSTPVFRYALERWPPENYEIVLFHDGALNATDTAIAEWLKDAAEDRPERANLRLVRVDLSGKIREEMALLWAVLDEAKAPCLVLRFPKAYENREPLWHGPLTMKSAKALVDSPMRQELPKRLGRGDSAVWVMLDGKDPKRNSDVAAFLAKELTRLEKTLSLPEGDDDGEQPESLAIRFSTIHVSRDDPKESVLARMLLASEKDLMSFDGPIVFPVFGRGRALYALVDKGITAQNIQKACAFLVGACACTDKELNPGVDLLVRADWDAIMGDPIVEDPAPPPLTGAIPSPPPSPPTQAAEPTANVRRPLRRNLMIVLIGGATVVLVGCIFALKRGGKR